MTDQEIIDVVAARKAGKQIQYKNKGGTSEWSNCCDNDPVWDFSSTDYRVKPEPKTIWVVTFNDGSQAVRHTEHEALDSQHRWTNRNTGQKPTITKYIEVL